MRSIDMQYQQQVRCRYNMGDMLCMSRMMNANVGMLAHFVLGRAMEGKSRQDKTRQDETRNCSGRNLRTLPSYGTKKIRNQCLIVRYEYQMMMNR